MWPWRGTMPTRNLLRFYCCWCWCWETCWQQFGTDLEAEVCSDVEQKVLKLKFRRNFEAEVWLRSWSLILVAILKLGLVKILNLRFNRDADVWLRFSWCLVGFLKMKFDQDLCKNLWFDLKKLLWQNSTLGSVVPLAVFKLEFPGHFCRSDIAIHAIFLI